MFFQNKLRISIMLFCVSLMFSSLFIMKSDLMIIEFELFKISSLSFGLSLIIDKMSLWFGVLVTFVSACVFMFACEYMKLDSYFWRFIWILLSFVVSMNLLIFSGSLFFLLLGWDGLGISSFALIIYYQSQESLSGGFQTLMANRVGDSLIVVGTFLMCTLGHFDFFFLEKAAFLLVVLLTLAAMTKSAQYPFCSWLPAAMAAPTPVSALVHSSTLVTAGIFLIIRLSHNLELNFISSGVLLLVGAVTCLLGGWAATVENDLKKIIALSTLSQLGVMVFCLGMGYPMLALFHLFTHALFKALLFVAAGVILMSNFGVQDIRLLGSTTLKMPFLMIIFNVTSLCLVGAPFLSAFYSKHTILEMMMSSSLCIISVVIMLLATMMTAKYVFRVLKSVNWTNPISVVNDVPGGMKLNFPMLFLCLGAIMAGKFFTALELNEFLLVPNFYSSLINLVTLMGLVLGLLSFPSASWFLPSLFFLSPLFIFSIKILSPIKSTLFNLDYGWLEPTILKNNMSEMGWKMSEFFNWPFLSSSFTRVFLMSVFSMFVINFTF